MTDHQLISIELFSAISTYMEILPEGLIEDEI
jgi:hypothetical protein